MVTSRSHITVRQDETDRTGLVYHANYLTWFDIGRAAMSKEHGLDYRDFEAKRYLLPVLEVGIKFFQPAKYDESLVVITTLREKPILRIRLNYEVWREDALLCEGHTVQVFVGNAGELTRPPPEFTATINRLFPAADTLVALVRGQPQNSTAGP